MTIAQLVEEGEQRAAIELREGELKMERWAREEAERRCARHLQESREELAATITAWGTAMQVEGFFEDAERRAAALGDAERVVLLERLQRARALLGGVDALERFLTWKAPEERAE